MVKKIDLTGQRFGRLVVVGETEERRGGHVLWECRCACGNVILVVATSLKTEKTKSCGCLQSEITSKMMKSENRTDCVEGTVLRNLKNKLSSRNKSGYKGVSWVKTRNKWRAEIGFKGERIHLGYYENKQDAINARLEAEEKYFKPILEKYEVENKPEELEG